MLHLRVGSPEEFASVHQFLRESGYTEPAICARLEIASIHQLVGQPDISFPTLAEDEPLALLIRIFLMSETASVATLDAMFQSPVVNALRSLGLLTEAAEPGWLRASMALYPAYGLYFVSDLWINVPGGASDMIADLVFPAIGPNTRDFCDILPQGPCEDFLELCSGTGVAALLAASNYASRSWAVDITERSTFCAEFGRRLNAIENVSVVRGDLYAPLDGRRFDRIVAHPPYVPALEPDKLYCDGGPDGQRIVQSIVQGVASHLNPGGRFHCLTMGIERKDLAFEQQVRQWLPSPRAEFDVIFFVHKTHSLAEFAHQNTISRRGDRKLVKRWIAHFESLGITSLALGEVVIRRVSAGDGGVTLRRVRGARSGRAEVEWLLRWQSFIERRDSEWMLDSRPALSPEAELCVKHRLRSGVLAPVQFTLQAEYPFSIECQTEPWMAIMLARCDGMNTIAAIFESCRKDRLIHPEAPIDEFVKLMWTLISGGFLVVEGFCPPQMAGKPLDSDRQSDAIHASVAHG